MMNKPQIIFLGTRESILERIISMGLNLCYALVTEGSFAHKYVEKNKIDYFIINKENKQEAFHLIENLEFDLAVSNGFPFLLPLSDLRKKHQNFINFHPSLLPDYIGLHPVNGVLLKGEEYTGITCHFIDDGMDTGNIIYQKKIPLTEDIDSRLLYQMLFRMEGDVFEEAYNLLAHHNFNWEGIKQTGEPSIYFRKRHQREIKFNEMSADNIIKIVRAFSNNRLGAICSSDNIEVQIFDAEKIKNTYLKNLYHKNNAGEILMVFDGNLLLKANDDIIRVRNYSSSDNLKEGIIFQ